MQRRAHPGPLDRVGLAWLTHAAGLASTGDPRLDAALPPPERDDSPSATVAAIAETRRQGGRVVAVGTTVALLYALHVAAGGYRGHEFGDSTLVLG